MVALRVLGGASLSRKNLKLHKYVGIYGAKGMPFIKVNDASAGLEGVQSSIVKFFTAEMIEQLLSALALSLVIY